MQTFSGNIRTRSSITIFRFRAFNIKPNTRRSLYVYYKEGASSNIGTIDLERTTMNVPRVDN